MSGRCLLLVISLVLLGFEHWISHASAIIRCQEKERKALVEFKRGLRDPSNRLLSWVGEDCCTWEGVGCTNFTDGHVVNLDLRNTHKLYLTLEDCSDDVSYYSIDDDLGCKWALHGHISPTLLSLKHLNHLDLSGNYFQRNHIPKFLASFRRLTYLNLSGAGFTGSVPTQLGNLSTLRHLDLSYNCYANYFYYPVCLYLENSGWISRLTSLRHLNMNWASFKNSSYWLQALNVLPYIQKIELVACDLGTIPRSLPHLNFTSLTALDLRGNDINSTVPDWLFNITSLEYLDLGWNSLSGLLPTSIWNLASLRMLGLSGNLFHDGFTLRALSNLCKLRILRMSYVPIKDVLANLEVVFSGCLMSSLEELDLTGTLLSGSMPDWLGNIKNLKYLDLSYNSLYGWMPASLGNLSLLKHLDVANNDLNGTMVEGIGRLQGLVYLDLSYNSLSFSEVHLFNLSSLNYLDISYNSMVLKESHDWIPHFQLETLKMAFCQIGPRPHLPKWLQTQKTLIYLDVSSNGLNGTIEESIGQLKGLVHLNLYNNSLNLLEVHLTNLSNLKHLDISYNSLVFNESHDWIPSFQLETLFMTSCQIGSRPQFLKWLQTQRILLELDVSSNDLNGAIAEGIGQMKSLVTLYLYNISLCLSEVHLANLSSLKYLDISYNSLVFNESHDWIPPFLLKSLYMSFCKILPMSHFPKWLRTQNTLYDLDLTNAEIKESIPNWLPSNYLKYLYLSNNEITGEVPQHFPNLTNLDLSNNSLSGHLPLRIGNTMPKLNYLDLSMNNLSGSIPLSFCRIESWFILRLSNNNLSGKLPNCWKNSSQLFLIDFSNNHLNGGFPSSLCSSRILESLHLSNNNLSGQISFYLKSCTSLVTLDLGHNKFIGNLSNWTGESNPHLKALSLRSNAFTGSIFQLSHLASLQILDLSNNGFSGTIPSSFGNLSALKGSPPDGSYFDTYGYYDDMWLLIKGSELEYKRLLSVVRVIDLSNNNLSGDIPEDLGNLNGLQSLNLSGNHLTGEIPKNISGMQHLEVLDLSRNDLSGAIPSSLAALNFLEQLNLSYNNLSGQIPTGNQLQTFIDPSIYIGNLGLCGPPLVRNCTDDDMTKNNEGEQDKNTKSETKTIWSYTSIALGFITGFWAICGTLLYQRRYRIVYFRAIDSMYDTISVLMTVNMAKLKRDLFIKDQDD